MFNAKVYYELKVPHNRDNFLKTVVYKNAKENLRLVILL